MKQLLVLLYNCVPNMKNYYSIDRLLKNVNILLSGTGKIQILLYIVIQKK